MVHGLARSQCMNVGSDILKEPSSSHSPMFGYFPRPISLTPSVCLCFVCLCVCACACACACVGSGLCGRLMTVFMCVCVCVCVCVCFAVVGIHSRDIQC